VAGHNATEGAAPQQAAPSSRLLSMAEAAEFLNVPVRWLQDAVQQRRIRCTRIGKHVRFTTAYLLEFVAAGEQPVAQPARPVAPLARRYNRPSRL